MKAHIQPIIFSSRNRKRRRHLSQRGYFWVRYGLGAALITAIYFWSK
jgi:hypothetical protein